MWYQSLALFFCSRGEGHRALSTWQAMAMGQLSDPEGRDGVRDTIHYLQRVEDTELVWQFSLWVLRDAPEKGLKIFTGDKHSPPLAPERVLRHLGAFPTPTRNTLCAEYLEYVGWRVWCVLVSLPLRLRMCS